MADLIYALDNEGKLVHIDSVPNGLACQCTCPGCGAALVAKNNGETMTSHFAHYFGTDCPTAHESLLHMMAKEIIASEKKIMLPSYGTVFEGCLQHFDDVEVEKRNDVKSLQPDLCGIVRKKDGTESRLWIEIKVTHAIGHEKRLVIQKEGISCMEVDLGSFRDLTTTMETLRHFLTSDKEHREWTNNPILEKRQRETAEKKREYAEKMSTLQRQRILNSNDSNLSQEDTIKNEKQNYLQQHSDQWIQSSTKCLTCQYHSTRQAIFEEIKRRHLSPWLRDALSCNLKWLERDEIRKMLVFRGCYVFCYQDFLQLIPTESPDIHGRVVPDREIRQNKNIIPFLLNTVPDIMACQGIRCQHQCASFPSAGTGYDIACNMPKIVGKHRRKR